MKSNTITKPDHKLWAFGLGTLLVLAIWASYFLFASLLPLFLAFGLAYAFEPLVNIGEQKGLPRTLAVFLLMLGLSVSAGLLIFFIFPILFAESREFCENFPGQVTILAEKIAEFGNRHGMNLPVHQELAKKVSAWTEKVFSSALSSGFGSGGQLYTSMSGLMEVSLNLLVIPVFFFYLLRDLPAIKRQGVNLIPLRHRPAVLSGLRKIDGVFSTYIRSQLTVTLILAVIFSASLSLLDVRYGLVIGIFSGFLNLVPYLGQAIGVILSLLMVLVDFKGWGRVIAIPLIFSVINFIEGMFITPRIVGNTVGLSSLQTLVVLFLGADIAGMVGMVVAIPLAASFKVLLLELFQEYKKSHFYIAKSEKA